MEETSSPMEAVPLEILLKIFANFDLPTRGYASVVCRRWRNLLLSSHSPMEDVVVMNIFERSVWEDHVKNNKGVRVKTVQMEDVETLKTISQLVTETTTVKFWYKNEEFAKNCIDVISDSKLQLKTVDLYPYGADLVLDKVLEKLPDLSSASMRPHEKSFFWNGLDLKSFPAFQNMTTLCIDTINLNEDIILPESLQCLEFVNRNSTKHMTMLNLLSPLKNLGALSISHADFSAIKDFQIFLDSIDAVKLPKLNFLTLRFSKLPSEACVNMGYVGGAPILENGVLNERKMNLRMLRIDLCYGPIDTIGSIFLSFNKNLSLLILHIMNEPATLKEVGELSKELVGKTGLNLSIMQRDVCRGIMRKEETEQTIEFPPSLFKVLTKFEASFVDKYNLPILDGILLGLLTVCREVKLISCPGVNDNHMTSLAATSKNLNRLSVISCDNVTEQGMLSFFKEFDARRSPKLEIIWKRKNRYPRPANLYLDIAHRYRELIKNKKLRFSTKTFTEEFDGERVMLWERDSMKRLYLQDFSEPDEYRIIGVVIGLSSPPEDISLIPIEDIPIRQPSVTSV